MSLPPRPEGDPRPLPPERPSNEDCCQSGCSPCIFDLYDEEVDRWRTALAAWQAREAARQAAAQCNKKGAPARGAKQPKAAHAAAAKAARDATAEATPGAPQAREPTGPAKAKAHAGTSSKRAAETSG